MSFLSNRHDVSVAISTSIITYKNNTHSVRDTRCSQAGQSPTSPRGGSGPFQGQSIWDLWLTKSDWNRFYTRTLPLSLIKDIKHRTMYESDVRMISVWNKNCLLCYEQKPTFLETEPTMLKTNSFLPSPCHNISYAAL